LAYGKSPYGTYINKDFLCCNYKNKEFSYKIENKDSKQLYTDIYNLVANKLGVFSKLEKTKKRLLFQDIESKLKESRVDWLKIRKKNTKDLLIEQYVIRMKKKYFLSIKQTKNLLSRIFISIIFKVILPKCIKYNNNMINNIEGIKFQRGKIIFHKELYNNISNGFDPHIIMDKKIMSDNWDKYLKK